MVAFLVSENRVLDNQIQTQERRLLQLPRPQLSVISHTVATPLSTILVIREDSRDSWQKFPSRCSLPFSLNSARPKTRLERRTHIVYSSTHVLWQLDHTCAQARQPSERSRCALKMWHCISSPIARRLPRLILRLQATPQQAPAARLTEQTVVVSGESSIFVTVSCLRDKTDSLP